MVSLSVTLPAFLLDQLLSPLTNHFILLFDSTTTLLVSHVLIFPFASSPLFFPFPSSSWLPFPLAPFYPYRTLIIIMALLIFSGTHCMLASQDLFPSLPSSVLIQVPISLCALVGLYELGLPIFIIPLVQNTSILLLHSFLSLTRFNQLSTKQLRLTISSTSIITIAIYTFIDTITTSSNPYNQLGCTIAWATLLLASLPSEPHFPILSQAILLVTSTYFIFFYNYLWPIYLLGVLLLLFIIELPLILGGTYWWTTKAHINTSAYCGVAFGLTTFYTITHLPFFQSLPNDPAIPTPPTPHDLAFLNFHHPLSSVLCISYDFFYYFGYLTAWTSMFVLTWDYHSIMLPTICSFVNLCSINFIRNPLFWKLNIISLAEYSVMLALQKSLLGAILNSLFSLLSVFSSALLIHVHTQYHLIPVLTELLGIVSLVSALSFLVSQPTKTSIVACYSLSYFSGLLSSLKTPSVGYLEFIGALLGLRVTWDLVKKRRKMKGVTTAVYLVLLSRTSVIISACVLLLLTPILGNLLIYYLALGILIYTLTTFLTIPTSITPSTSSLTPLPSSLSLAIPSLTTLFLCAPIILIGITIQSRLVILLGFTYIFMALHTLSNIIFPRSSIYPFILTLFGISFIYLGLSIEKYNDLLAPNQSFYHDLVNPSSSPSSTYSPDHLLIQFMDSIVEITMKYGL